MGIEAPPNKAMEPTEQGKCFHSFVQAMQRPLVLRNQSPGLAGANTKILPPRLIAGR
jgi:hypothetical protein